MKLQSIIDIIGQLRGVVIHTFFLDYFEYTTDHVMMNDVIRLKPLYKERVWGGRKLESIFHRQLPTGVDLVGESWDIVDREESQSIVSDGELKGKTLNELWLDYKESIFGPNLPEEGRFPVLIKILDARKKLSLQVHPPENIASEIGADPKTEMWYIAEADPGAEIYCGFKDKITSVEFIEKINGGLADDLLHKIAVAKGDFIFIPSGRLHAIGGGIVIFEIQQNSDTTYRVHDWGRTGLDGNPRKLHIDEAIRSIDFKDIQPSKGRAENNFLVRCPYFEVEQVDLLAMEPVNATVNSNFAIISVIEGALSCGRSNFMSGDSFIVPAQIGAEPLQLACHVPTRILRTTIPKKH
ncbi:MAG TPA: mannose-6-phosphate isomerase [Verrucomicrobiales bacterium]|nr:mannose-6-phosphate isomerase [Verrucomicrobiales bacterium]